MMSLTLFLKNDKGYPDNKSSSISDNNNIKKNQCNILLNLTENTTRVNNTLRLCPKKGRENRNYFSHTPLVDH